jgi:hypothetical protein
LDLFPSQSDLQNKTNQIHDFNPGFGDPVNANDDRTFWTVAIPPADIVYSHPGAGEAEMKVTNLAIEDYFNLGNALMDGPSVGATVSFDVVWTGNVTRHVNEKDATNQFAGEYAETQATVTWSGNNANGFSFMSDPASTSTSNFAETGHEHNGIFFPDSPSKPSSAANTVLIQALAAAPPQPVSLPPPHGSSAPALRGKAGNSAGSTGQSTGQPPSGDSLGQGAPASLAAVSTLDSQAVSALFTAIGRSSEDSLFSQ